MDQEKILTNEFRLQLLEDGWTSDYIDACQSRASNSEDLFQTLRRSLIVGDDCPYSNQQLREGIFKVDKDVLAPMLRKALVQIITPWLDINADIPQNIQVSEVSRATNLSPQRVINLLNRFPVTIQVGRDTFKAKVEIELPPGNERILLAEAGIYNVSPKRIAGNGGKYESRPPGGGPVQRSRQQAIRVNKAIRKEASKRARIVFEKVEITKDIDTVQKKPVKTRQEILIKSVNYYFDQFTLMGPFYGSGEKGITPPTFKISSEPISLPEYTSTILEQTGQDLGKLARSLNNLPTKYKKLLGGKNYSFRIPPTWRTDNILTPEGNLLVNEIETDDGADALMIAEQLVYGLQTLDTSTAAYLALRIWESFPNLSKMRMACIWDSLNDPYIANAKRMCEFIEQASDGNIQMQIVIIDQVNKQLSERFDGFINASTLSLTKLAASGIRLNQIFSAGSYCAFGNKALFALLSGKDLQKFWRNELGEQTLQRLKDRLPFSKIAAREDIERAIQTKSFVIKAFNSPKRELLECTRGVFGPWCEIEEWQVAFELFEQDTQFIVQKFVRPAILKTTFRTSRGNKLEELIGFNRICAKYVAFDNEVFLTATEATLGPNLVPTGRDCCFAPVMFK